MNRRSTLKNGRWILVVVILMALTLFAGCR